MLTPTSSSPMPTGQLTRLQYFLTVIARLKSTPTCLLIYLVLILLNIFVMAYEYSGGSTRHWLAISLEAVINLVLATEVLTSILHQRSAYFHHSVNLVDLVLTCLCLLFFVLFLVKPPSSSDTTYGEIDTAILIVRYGFQLTRISVLIYRGRKTTAALTVEDIDFTVHAMRDRIDAELSDAASSDKSADTAPAHKKHHTSRLEQQQLLRTHEDDPALPTDEEWRQKERGGGSHPLAGLELELKRGDREEDEEEGVGMRRPPGKGKGGAAPLATSGPVKRSVSPGTRQSLAAAGGAERKKGLAGLAKSVSDLSLSHSAQRLREEDEDDEDALADDDLV